MIHRLFALALVLMMVFQPGLASAQEALTLPDVEVDLWPEYDRPSMLVIYHLSLPNDVTLPAQLSLRIPAAAGEPNAVASRQPDNTLLTVPYEREVQGEWAVITFNATTTAMQVEYYDPGLAIEGSQRTYTYIWPGDYAVNTLILQVQRPVDVGEMSLSPRLGTSSTGSDGLTYYSSDFGTMPAGETFQVDISYQKSSDTLSASQVAVQPSGPVGQETSGRSSGMADLPWVWVLAGLGALLIAAGLFWYWKSGQEGRVEARPAGRNRESRNRGRSSTTARRETGEAPEGERIYCAQCGKRAAPGDRFCRTCGAPLRSP